MAKNVNAAVSIHRKSITNEQQETISFTKQFRYELTHDLCWCCMVYYIILNFLGIGALIFALPKLIIGNYEPAKASGETLLTCQLNGTAPDACVTPSGGKHLYVFIFVLAELLMGAGTTPLYTLGKANIILNFVNISFYR